MPATLSAVARTREHQIETESRRIVASLLPADRFVERDQTERDYGVDMTVKCFDPHGEPTGHYLLLQLKGTDRGAPSKGAMTVPFDMSVRTLRRSERYITPILLVYCPVREMPVCFYFLWLQEYVKVVLDIETPDWRQQQGIRVHVPCDNRIPDIRQLARWHHIAAHPARLADFGQLARIAHEVRWHIDAPDKLLKLFHEARGLNAIFDDSAWEWGQMERENVERGAMACQWWLAGTIPDDYQLASLGWRFEAGQQIWRDAWRVSPPSNPQSLVDSERRGLLHSSYEHSAQTLSTAVAIYNDYRMRHTVWRTVGDHEF